jgi:flagellar protein FliO/FliZ
MGFADFLRAVFALALTLGLIGLAAWAARRFAPEWLGRLQSMRRDRRLSIVETLPLDPNRRLVLVRMDDTERLLLLGEGRMLAEAPARPEPPPEQAKVQG